MDNILKVVNLAQADYVDTLTKMQNFNQRRTIDTLDELWLVEHPAIFTLGYQGDQSHILQQDNKIPVVQSDRGGNITFHGPGQIVGYLMINLKRKSISITQLIHSTEQAIIDLLTEYKLLGHRIPQQPGIYINQAKICSLGFRVKRGCSYHGFAFNTNMDLSPFAKINPCGLTNMSVTQLANFVDKIDINVIKTQLICKLKDIFSYNNIIYP